MTVVRPSTGSSAPKRRKSSQLSAMATSSVPPALQSGSGREPQPERRLAAADLRAVALGHDGAIAVARRGGHERLASRDHAVAAGAGHSDDEVRRHEVPTNGRTPDCRQPRYRKSSGRKTRETGPAAEGLPDFRQARAGSADKTGASRRPGVTGRRPDLRRDQLKRNPRQGGRRLTRRRAANDRDRRSGCCPGAGRHRPG